VNSFAGNLAMPYGYFTQSVENSISSFAETMENVFVVGG